MLIDLDFAQNGRTIRLRTYQLPIVGDISFLPFTALIGFSDSLGDYNVNCCHTDVSLFVRISIL